MTSEPTAGWTGPSFDPFFAATYQPVVALVAATAGDADLAEHATQEAFRLAQLRWSGVRTMNRPDVWVARVAIRIAIDAWRKRQTATGPIDDLPTAVPPEVRQLWARWELEALPPRTRATILLRRFEEMKVVETKERYQRPAETLTTSGAADRIFHLLILNVNGNGSDG